MAEKKSRVSIIGLCGRSGSGKTTVCAEFAKHGIPSVDTDKVYRELTAPSDGVPSSLVRRMADIFGEGIIADDGALDRRTLADAVFGDGKSENLSKLNSLTHGPILERSIEIADEYAAVGANAVIIDAPVLFESGFHEKCNSIVCVIAPDDVLVRRIVGRDGISEDAARKRLASQLSADELVRRSDYVIVNDGSENVPEQVKKCVKELYFNLIEYGDLCNNET